VGEGDHAAVVARSCKEGGEVVEVPELAAMVIGGARRGGDPPHQTGLL